MRTVTHQKYHLHTPLITNQEERGYSNNYKSNAITSFFLLSLLSEVSYKTWWPRISSFCNDHREISSSISTISGRPNIKTSHSKLQNSLNPLKLLCFWVLLSQSTDFSPNQQLDLLEILLALKKQKKKS